MYKRKPVAKLTGSENFINTDSKNFSVLDFWQYNLSNLNSNVTRGALAEFLVENALKDVDDIEIRNPWGDYDVEYKGKKIEVKCSSYLQDWDQGDLSKPTFTGLKAKELYYNDVVGEKSDKKADYKADIYVLCLFKHKKTKTLNILDLDQWEFYILAKDKLKEISNDRSSISLIRLRKNNIQPLRFNNIAKTIESM